ncbi:MAG TPA: preprotein translocase subunit YajC [Candidatus Angelobacter sp.]|nr:preprotein translocase subunit YajC [Candidatus Angelobacter sp.]
MIQSHLSFYLFQAAAPGGIFAFSPLVMMVLMVGVFYVLLILPQQRRQKRWQEMVNNLKAGDKVTTSGGVRGTIIAVKDDALHLRVPPDNLRLEIVKSSIVSVVRDEEPKK